MEFFRFFEPLIVYFCAIWIFRLVFASIGEGLTYTIKNDRAYSTRRILTNIFVILALAMVPSVTRIPTWVFDVTTPYRAWEIMAWFLALVFLGLTFGFVWKMIPFSALIIHGGFQMIDNSYIEAARSCGAGLVRVITRVLVPMNRSSILVALVLVYSQIVGTFTLPYMLIGGKIPTTITVDIAHRINYFRDFGVANTLGVFSYLLVLMTAVYYLRSSVKKMTGYQASEA